MKWIREPAVAGSFYPSDPVELRAVVESLLDNAPARPGAAPRALIVPHAGYVYSGCVAARAYVQLLPHRESYHRVVLMGPAHRVALRGVALPGKELIRGPFGLIPMDPATYTLLDFPGVAISERAHRNEHALEVQLPFLQRVLGNFTLVPLVVGETDPDRVADVIEHLWSMPGTLVVVSSDLSHYLDYAEATRRDARTRRAIEELDDFAIDPSDACGCESVRGLLVAARRAGLTVQTLDVRNSGDTAGMADRVVGYGAWMFLGDEPCERAA